MTYVTAGTEGSVYVWHLMRVASTWTSKERFPTLADAVAAAQRVAHSKGADYRNGTQVITWQELDEWNQTPFWQEVYNPTTLQAWKEEEKAQQEEQEWKNLAHQW